MWCHFLQPVVAASWHSKESGWDLLCRAVAWPGLTKGIDAQSKGDKGQQQQPEPQPEPQPYPGCHVPSQCLPTPGLAGCHCSALSQQRLVLSHLHPILHIRDCSVGSSSPHKGVSRKCDFKGWKCPATKPGVWLQGLNLAQSRNVQPCEPFVAFLFLQHFFGVSHHCHLLISTLIVGCLLLLKCAKTHSSGKSTLTNLKHL